MNDDKIEVGLRQGDAHMLATLTKAEIEMCKKIRKEDPAKWERNEACLLLEAQRRLSEASESTQES